MTQGNGMSHAPKGKPDPVCGPGEFTIAAVALEHGHIHGMCNGLTEAGATLKWVYDPDPAKVQAFVKAFPQAAPARSEEEVLADDENMRFDVVDRGEGIPKELHQEIFKAFELDWGRLERGSGLGLDVSRRLALLLGGDLRVESKPGHGARFILELPRHGEHA